MCFSADTQWGAGGRADHCLLRRRRSRCLWPVLTSFNLTWTNLHNHDDEGPVRLALVLSHAHICALGVIIQNILCRLVWGWKLVFYKWSNFCYRCKWNIWLVGICWSLQGVHTVVEKGFIIISFIKMYKHRSLYFINTESEEMSVQLLIYYHVDHLPTQLCH